jgi:hypothetical protein
MRKFQYYASFDNNIRFVNTLALICLPFNINKIIYPYENLLSFENLGKFIAGVSNPIFET